MDDIAVEIDSMRQPLLQRMPKAYNHTMPLVMLEQQKREGTSTCRRGHSGACSQGRYRLRYAAAPSGHHAVTVLPVLSSSPY
jgi:hypothetical protein